MHDERDAAKTFGKAWLAGHAGTIGGAALGAAALGSRPGRRLLVGIRRSGFAKSTKNAWKSLKQSPVGKTSGKFFGHKAGPAAIGAATGAIVGGDIGDYAAIRHGIIESKKNAQKQGK